MNKKINSLSRYQQKRDFNQTDEPTGSEKAFDTAGNIFVVQKHAAKNLHYDFRLAIDGVLKSWALPKRPPLSSGLKRLAVRTEDHPLEYSRFEGTIPAGQYGAGKVEIWDRGHFRFAKESRGLERGELKIILTGSKLKGQYILIRPKDFKKGQWLFFKTEKH